jgi:pSer/pThr/pTyr-binding forkhead associated (FHA) protein
MLGAVTACEPDGRELSSWFVVEASQTKASNAAEAKALIEAERANVPFLHWRDGDGVLRILLISPGRERVTIGRRADSDVSLGWDAEVSRAHALLESVGRQWTLIDDGLSRNGSFVNGGRVHGRRRLRNRDRLCFGNTHVSYREPTDAESAESTARALDAPASMPLSVTQKKVLVALCRPLSEETSATPATNRQIADEIFLSVDAVKAHLRLLFERFGVEGLPQNEKRAQLALKVLDAGLLAPHDF